MTGTLDERDDEIARLRERWEASQLHCHELIDRAETAEARLAEQENAVTWLTSCLNCASLLDASYGEYVRADQAEQLIRRVTEHARVWVAAGNPSYARAGQQILADLGQLEAQPKETP